MRFKYLIIGVLVAAAFAAGYWPAQRRALEAEQQLQTVRQQLATTERRDVLNRLLGQLLAFSESVSASNFGLATSRSSAFFDRVRTELALARDETERRTLARVLLSRDQVTALLVRADPAVAAILRQHELEMRSLLGYAVGLESPAPASATP